MVEQVIWGIHAGKTGDAEALFAESNCIAVGWPEMGDLSTIKPSRDAFKARYSSVFPSKSAGHVPVAAGQLFRFAKEIKVGDLVVFPAKLDRTVRIKNGGSFFRAHFGKRSAEICHSNRAGP